MYRRNLKYGMLIGTGIFVVMMSLLASYHSKITYNTWKAIDGTDVVSQPPEPNPASPGYYDWKKVHDTGAVAKLLKSNSADPQTTRALITLLPSTGHLQYMALWNFASDLRQYWMLIRSSLREEDISKRNTDVIEEGYRTLLNEIHNMTESAGSKVRQVLGVSEKDILANILSDFKKFWAASQSMVTIGNVSNSALDKINERYRRVSEKTGKLMDLSFSQRKRIVEKLSGIVRRKIDVLQYGKHCSRARIQICGIPDAKCGLGCQLHWTTNCMMTAFEKERMVVYKSRGWNYAGDGWEHAFLPIGKCTYPEDVSELPGVESDDSRVVKWEKWDRTSEVSYTIPAKLAPSLMAVHGEPAAWWVSQFVSYLTRYQPWLKNRIENLSAKIGFKSPVVGIHIRWGDKLRREARKFEVEDYMFFVEQWFLEYEMTNKGGKRTVYVATDDKHAVDDLLKNFPEYTFIMNNPRATDKYNHASLEAILTDLHFLSRSDYVVCTLSSNVGRTVYELMNSIHPDASKRIQSVDIAYRFTNRRSPMKVILGHTHTESYGEEQISVGDEIIVGHNQFDPSNQGFLWVNPKNKTKGRWEIPAFKVRGTVRLKNYSIFNDVTFK